MDSLSFIISRCPNCSSLRKSGRLKPKRSGASRDELTGEKLSAAFFFFGGFSPGKWGSKIAKWGVPLYFEI